MANIGVIPAIEAASQKPNGMDCKNVPGFDPHAVAMMAQKLCADGKLHRAKLGHKTVRYFDTAERAAAYMVKNGPSAGQVRAAEARKKAAEFKALKTVTPAGIKKEVRENYPPHRFYVDPASLQPGPFSSMKPGQYAFEPASCAARAA